MDIRPLNADDIFISYTRRDASTYANGLADELGKRNLSCYLDALGTEPGADLPESLKRRIRSSQMFVVICTRRAGQRETIRKEIEEFLKTDRKQNIIPVNINGSFYGASWIKLLEGVNPATEASPLALKDGNPSPQVVERIDKQFIFRRGDERRQRLQRNAIRFLVFLCGLIVLAAAAVGYLSWLASDRRQKAERATLAAQDALVQSAAVQTQAVTAKLAAELSKADAETAKGVAETQKGIAERANKDAQEKTKLAGEATRRAQDATEQAKTAREEADTARDDATEQKRLADLAAKDAEKKKQEADEATLRAKEAEDRATAAKARADREQAVADSRSIADRSQTLLRQRPKALQRSIRLAVEAMRKSTAAGVHTIETDTALRESVALLPNYVGGRVYPGDFAATALSPDARYFAALKKDGELLVSKVGSDEPPRSFKCGEGTAVALSNRAEYAAVGKEDEVKVCNLKTGAVHAVDVSKGENKKDEFRMPSISKLALSPNGRYFAMIRSVGDTSTQSGMADIEAGLADVSVWPSGGEKMIEKLVDGEPFHSVSFSDTGDLALAGTVRMRDEFSNFAGGVSIWPLSEKMKGVAGGLVESDFDESETHMHSEEVLAVAIAPGEKVYATDRAILKRNDVGIFTDIARFPFKEDVTYKSDAMLNISDLAFTPDGKRLVAVRQVPSYTSADGTRTAAGIQVELWETAQRPEVAQTFLQSRVSNIGFLPGDHSVAAAFAADYGSTGNPHIFDAASGAEKPPVAAVPHQPEDSPDNAVAKCISRDARFVVYGHETAAYVLDALRPNPFKIELGAVFDDSVGVRAGLSAGGEFLVLAGGRPDSDEAFAAVYKLEGDSYRQTGSFPLTGIAKGKLYSGFPGFPGKRLVVTPDGARLLILVDGKVRVWEVPVGREVTPTSLSALARDGEINEVTMMELSDGGRYVAVAYKKRSDKIDEYGEVETDPEDDYLSRDALGSKTPEVVAVVRLSDGALAGTVEHAGEVTSMLFSPRGRYLLTSGYDGVTHLTDLNDMRSTRLSSDSLVTAAAFSADEQRFALGADDGTRVYASDSPQAEVSFLPDTGTVNALAFNSDGSRLATSSARTSTQFQDSDEDFPLRVWMLRPGDILAEAYKRLASIPPYLREDTAAHARPVEGEPR